MDGTKNIKGLATEPLRLPRGRTLVCLLVVILLAGGTWAAWKALEKRPFMARWKVGRYLKKESRMADFKVAFRFPTKEEMAQVPSTPVASEPQTSEFEALRDEYFALKIAALRLERTVALNQAALAAANARLQVLTNAASPARAAQRELSRLKDKVAGLEKKATLEEELKAKEATLGPLVQKLWEFQRRWIAEFEPPAVGSATLAQAQARFSSEMRVKVSEASSYSDIYRLIGQELWVADGLLKSKNPEHQRVGLTLALNAARNALDDAENGWVAARICEGYLLPHQDLARVTNPRSLLNADNFLNECAAIFRRNNETVSAAHLYESELARAKTSQRADWARSQIARAYEDAGDIHLAVQYLRQIQNTNDYRWIARRLPRLEAQLKTQ
jgi:hypothetical protein